MQGRLAAVVAITSILSSSAVAEGVASLTDAQIAHFVHTAGQIDIEGAKQALSKSANKDVRAFAQAMVHDDAAVNKQTADVVDKLKLTPEDNDLSRALAEHAAYKRAELAKLNGAEFDKAYIANEAAYQMTVNGALVVTLIPSATNPGLKSLLQSGLKIFQGHQQHAKELASALK
jgi:putative membrane protein